MSALGLGRSSAVQPSGAIDEGRAVAPKDERQMTKAAVGALALLLIGAAAVEAAAQEGPLAYRKGAPGWQERQAAREAPRPPEARPAPEAPQAREPRGGRNERDDDHGRDRNGDRGGDRDHDRARDRGADRHDDHPGDRGRDDRRWDRGDHRDWERRRPRYDRRTYPPYWSSLRRYRISPYRPPVGFYVRRWGFGDILPRGWWGPTYRLSDWWAYGLPIPPVGFEWVRVGDDALLVDAYSGRVVQVAPHLFW